MFRGLTRWMSAREAEGRRPTRCPLGVATLEGRTLLSGLGGPYVTTSADTSTIWPANGRLASVTISGQVTDWFSKVNGPVTFTVANEPGYRGGIVTQGNTASLDANGNYSFTILLLARRHALDPDGRQYTIDVTATNAAGVSNTASTVVSVPHDAGQGNTSFANTHISFTGGGGGGGGGGNGGGGGGGGGNAVGDFVYRSDTGQVSRSGRARLSFSGGGGGGGGSGGGGGGGGTIDFRFVGNGQNGKGGVARSRGHLNLNLGGGGGGGG